MPNTLGEARACVQSNDAPVRVPLAKERPPDGRSDPDIEKLARHRAVAIVFIPNTIELQRFVLAGAFDELAKYNKLHYVLPAGEAEKIRSAAPEILTSSNTSEIDIQSDRFAKWARLFDAACLHYASLSRSFAIRVNQPISAGNSRLLRFLPQSSRQPALRLTKRLLDFGHWPDSVRRRLRSWNTVLQKATSFPSLSKREYDKLVANTLGDMKPLQEIVDLFDRFNPLYCIVPTSLLDIFCNDVVWACSAEEVSCVILQSGWDNLSSKGVLHSRKPFTGCWGPQSARHARDIQHLSPTRTHNLGAPHYEFLKPAAPEEIPKIRADLGVREDERIVLFGGSFRQFDETSTLLRLEEAIAAGRFGRMKIVYRPHPWRAARKYEDNFFQYRWEHVIFDPAMRDRYRREQAETGYIKRNVPMFDMIYLSRLLSAVDAVISPMSTLLIESLILEKPTMAIAFGDDKHSHGPSITSQMTHFAEVKTSDALIWCDNADLLIDGCASLIQPEKSERRMSDARLALIKQVVTREPGTYATRLADFCCQIVGPEACKMRITRTAHKRGTISHSYGANQIARDYCDLPIDEPVIPGYWMHGWIPAFHNVDPAFIALHKKDGQHAGYDYSTQIRDEKENTPQWVSRPDQAEYLLSHGYKHVKAIGLPITYLPKPSVRRVPGSLLVMPPHGHKSHGPEDPVAKLYASVIAALKPKFEHIYVGLSEDDISKHQWLEPFRRHGINVFATVEQTDPDTLTRLMRILSSFEYVTTNGFGSHIALAAYCGAKVSVYGPYAEFPRRRMKNTHAVKMFPKLLDKACYLCSERAMRKHYPFLFVEPDKARLLQEWGAHGLGENCRVSKEELTRLFEWGSKRTNMSQRTPPISI